MTSRLPFRWFGLLLPIVLAGYLFFDRSFAYLHVPGTPVFVGEILLVVGLVEAYRGRRTITMEIRQSLVLRFIVGFMLLGLARLLIVDLTTYGVLAVRDSALWYYAAFAPLVVLLLRVRADWLDSAQAWYERLLPLFLVWAPIAVILERTQPLPWTVPDSSMSITAFRPGNVGVHLALGLAYLWLVPPRREALRRHRGWLTALGLLGVLVVGTQNRAGLLAATFGLGLAWLLTPLRSRLTVTAGAAMLLLLSIPALLGLSVNVGGRQVSVAQVTENVSSIVLGARAEGNLGDTAEWRQRLWSLAVDDLFESGNAVLGFGYGPNIAARYSFSNPDAERALRNPHNSHLSILTRMGLVGALVWVLTWVAWPVPLARALRRTNLRHGPAALRLWTWSATGVFSMLLNAFFDPTLEGPQVGIWLWTLVGISVNRHRAYNDAISMRADTNPSVPVAVRRAPGPGSPLRSQ